MHLKISFQLFLIFILLNKLPVKNTVQYNTINDTKAGGNDKSILKMLMLNPNYNHFKQWVHSHLIVWQTWFDWGQNYAHC